MGPGDLGWPCNMSLRLCVLRWFGCAILQLPFTCATVDQLFQTCPVLLDSTLPFTLATGLIVIFTLDQTLDTGLLHELVGYFCDRVVGCRIVLYPRKISQILIRIRCCALKKSAPDALCFMLMAWSLYVHQKYNIQPDGMTYFSD